MSDVRIGRATFETPESAEWDGDTLTIAGHIGTEDGDASLNAGLAQRAQLVGLAEESQPIPVVVDDDPSATGYYWVTGVSVRMEGPSFGHGTFAYTIRLRPVDGASAPLLESLMFGAFRSGDTDLTAGDEITWHCVPEAAGLYCPTTGSLAWLATEITRASEDGDLRWFYRAGSANPDYHSARVRWQVPPEHFYDGAARIELLGDDDIYRPVIGTQIPNVGDRWRISNGLARIGPVEAFPTFAWYTFGGFNGTGWDDSGFSVGSYNTSHYDKWEDLQSISVLRNTPEEVAIRLGYATDYANLIDGYVDLSLRRGSRLVHLYATALPGLNVIAVWQSSEDEGAALNDGIRADDDDGNNNRYVIAGAGITNKDTTAAALRFGASAAAAVGLEIGGSGASGQEAAQALVHQFYAADTEHTVVAAR